MAFPRNCTRAPTVGLLVFPRGRRPSAKPSETVGRPCHNWGMWVGRQRRLAQTVVPFSPLFCFFFLFFSFDLHPCLEVIFREWRQCKCNPEENVIENKHRTDD